MTIIYIHDSWGLSKHYVGDVGLIKFPYIHSSILSLENHHYIYSLKLAFCKTVKKFWLLTVKNGGVLIIFSKPNQIIIVFV